MGVAIGDGSNGWSEEGEIGARTDGSVPGLSVSQ